MFKLKRMFVCMVVLAFFVVASSGSTAEWTPTEKFLKIGTASVGGLWYLTGARLAAEIEKAIPSIKVSTTTGGPLANVKRVNSGEAQMGLVFTAQAVSAYYGIDPYFKGKPHPNLRLLYTNNLCGYQFVVSKKSKIYGFKDLYKSRISPAPKTYSGYIVTQWVLDHYGISYDSIAKAGGMVTGLAYNDAAAMIQDGLLDGCVAISGGPMAYVINLSQNPGIRILPMEEEKRDKILADPRFKGWTKLSLPANIYEGIEKPIPTIATVEVFLVNKDVSDELVYRIAKLIHGSEGLQDLYKSARERGFPPAFNLSIAKAGMQIPVHPGAARFYKEMGITIPPIKK